MLIAITMILSGTIGLILNSILLPDEDMSDSLASLSFTPFVRIDDFTTNSSMTGSINFHFHSNTSFSLVIFLPASTEPWWFENTTIEISQNAFEINYSQPEFNGRLFSNGYYFPIDSYELTFIFGLNKDLDIQITNEEDRPYFGNSMLYDNWNIETKTTVHMISKSEAKNLLNHIAVGEKDFQKLVTENEITSFYLFDSSIRRVSVNLLRSILLLMVPSLTFVVLFCFTFVKKIWRLDLNKSIRLYTSISFALVGYFFTILPLIPPVITIFEAFIMLQIGLSMIALTFAIVRDKSE